MEEFFKQGDEERLRGMKVSPMFDRSDTCVPQMQANFIEFIVGPLTVSLTRVFPELQQLGEEVCANRREWGDRWMDIVREEQGVEVASAEAKKNDDRLKKFVGLFSFPKNLAVSLGPKPRRSAVARRQTAMIDKLLDTLGSGTEAAGVDASPGASTGAAAAAPAAAGTLALKKKKQSNVNFASETKR